MKPSPKCVIDRSRSCNACIAPDPRSCPYPYLLAEENQADTADAETEGRTTQDDRSAGSPPSTPYHGSPVGD